MRIEITQESNAIAPSLRKMMRGVKDRRPILGAIGELGVQHTKRAWSEPRLRPKQWAPLKSGAPARLRKSGALARSPRITHLTNDAVWIGTDRRYAAFHHFGTRHLPARPFFPVASTGGGAGWHPVFMRNVEAVIQARLRRLMA